VGRDVECQVCIGDLTVSREHARLLPGSEGWVVEDLQSGNGTFVNDERVRRQVLAGGDLVRVGECLFRFVADGRPERAWVNVATVLAESEADLIRTVSEVRRPALSPEPGESTEGELRRELDRTHRMLETLYAVADATSSLLEPGKLFNKILDYLFDTFQDADQGYVMLLDEQGQLVPGAVRRRREAGRLTGLTLAQAVVSRVLHEGKAVLAEVADETGEGKPCSTMGAPMTVRGKPVGILHIGARGGAKSFSQEDLDLLAGVAMLAGVAYHNAFMHQRLMRQQRLEQDLRFARQVQRSFLPSSLPEVQGFQFSRRYSPVFQVGGDFYDFISLPGERMGVLIGDVSGKGVSAALLMARLTSDIRAFAVSGQGPAEVMTRANDALISRVQDNMFATVLYLVLDPERGSLLLCNAGHIPPLLVRHGAEAVMEVDDATNLALGVLPDPAYDEVTLALGAGDSVLLCTDGVVEAKNIKDELYGFQRLHQALMAGPEGGDLLDGVLRDVQRFSRSTPQNDDITMVGIQRL